MTDPASAVPARESELRKEPTMTNTLPELPDSVLAALPPGTRAPARPICHRCDTVATVSWQRTATDDERVGYWAAIELNIRSQPNLFDAQNSEYTADRTQPVIKAVFGCDEHDLSPAPADGGKKSAAAAKQAGLELRALTHAADCGGHGECGCGGAA